MLRQLSLSLRPLCRLRSPVPGILHSARLLHSTPSTAMKVIPVPVRDDNYAYILKESADSTSAVFVDPFDLPTVQKAAEKEGVKEVLGSITTHHHFDHSGGNEAFAKAYPNATIWGGSDKVPALTKQTPGGDKFSLGSINVTTHATPCHTQDSVAFFIEDSRGDSTPAGEVKRGVFTGDTLFVSGCGRFFEGKPEEMHKALNVTLASLPDDTIVFCGHEYTASNVAFSLGVLPDRSAIKTLAADVKAGKNGGVTTGVYTIGDEKKHNVFMLVNDSEVQEKLGTKGDVIATMAALREAKNEGKYMAKI